MTGNGAPGLLVNHHASEPVSSKPPHALADQLLQVVKNPNKNKSNYKGESLMAKKSGTEDSVYKVWKLSAPAQIMGRCGKGGGGDRRRLAADLVLLRSRRWI